ncbi:hypothetical protein ACJJTC_019874 [Scirpophaga incertulas]
MPTNEDRIPIFDEESTDKIPTRSPAVVQQNVPTFFNRHVALQRQRKQSDSSLFVVLAPYRVQNPAVEFMRGINDPRNKAMSQYAVPTFLPSSVADAGQLTVNCETCSGPWLYSLQLKG